MHRWLRVVGLCLLGLGLLTGCDALDSTPGQADFLLTWPNNDSAHSVKVQLLQGSRIVKSRVVNRVEGEWQTRVEFDNLQMGTTEFIVTLYQHPDAVGLIRGQAHDYARVVRKDPVPHALVPDLAPDARLTIFPKEPIVYLDETLQLFASVRNPDNAYVLVPAGAFAWSVSDTGIAEVAPTSGQVTGVSVGQTTVTAKYGALNGQAILKVLYPKPTVDITADDTTVDPGEAVKLSWTSTNATRVESAVNFNTTLLNGSQTVYPEETTEYRITVKGPGGTATDAVTVNVTIPSPQVTLTASSTYILRGQSVVLTWTSRYATMVYTTSNFDANNSLNGSTIVTPDVTTTYAITVGSSGTQSASVTVVVAGT